MKFLVIDKAGLFWDAVSLYLQKVEPQVVLTFATQFEQAYQILRRENDFTLILVNPALVAGDALPQLSRILDMSGQAKLGLISEPLTRELVDQVMHLGASGYFPKTMRAESFVQAIRFVLSGEVFIPVERNETRQYFAQSNDRNLRENQEPWGGASDLQSAQTNISTQDLAKLSRREMQVLQVLADGHSNKEIARALDIQEVTVKQHVRSVMRKLDVSNRVQLARIAWTVKSM